MRIKCAVACINAAGSSDFFRVIIDCTEEQRDEAEHYDAAERQAAAAGYDDPYLVFADDDDGWKNLQFDWNDVPIIFLTQAQNGGTGSVFRG